MSSADSTLIELWDSILDTVYIDDFILTDNLPNHSSRIGGGEVTSTNNMYMYSDRRSGGEVTDSSLCLVLHILIGQYMMNTSNMRRKTPNIC